MGVTADYPLPSLVLVLVLVIVGFLIALPWSLRHIVIAISKIRDVGVFSVAAG